jgi:hypothetical protein
MNRLCLLRVRVTCTYHHHHHHFTTYTIEVLGVSSLEHFSFTFLISNSIIFPCLDDEFEALEVWSTVHRYGVPILFPELHLVSVPARPGASCKPVDFPFDPPAPFRLSAPCYCYSITFLFFLHYDSRPTWSQLSTAAGGASSEANSPEVPRTRGTVNRDSKSLSLFPFYIRARTPTFILSIFF